eukprot:scaffold203774_cov19-Tisochrysis_lutea.AAC.1
MKSGSCKLLFVSSLGDANMVDFRNKLLGDYSDSLGRAVPASWLGTTVTAWWVHQWREGKGKDG